MFFSLLVILIIVWIYTFQLNHPDFEVVTFEDIKDRCKTGDLILFHALDNTNPMKLFCYYGHVGVVYRDRQTQIPYIFEAFNYSTMLKYPKEAKNGIALSSLENRINSHRGYTFYKELEYPLSEQKIQEFEEFMKFAIQNMYYDIDVVSSAAGKIILKEPLNLGTNCAELTYISLIKLSLLPVEYLKQTNFHHLRYVCYLDKVKKNRYMKPVYVVSDYYRQLHPIMTS